MAPCKFIAASFPIAIQQTLKGIIIGKPPDATMRVFVMNPKIDFYEYHFAQFAFLFS